MTGRWLISCSCIWSLILVTGLTGCAGINSANEKSKTTDEILVWPAKPAPARISFETQWQGPADLGIKKGLWRRIRDLVTGPSFWQMVRPMAVLVTEDGIVYVADPGARGVHRFDSGSNSYRLIKQKKQLPLLSPVALAMGPGNRIYIADSSLKKIFVINHKAKVATPVKLNRALKQPTGIVWNAAMDRLYVADTKAHNIKIFSPEGVLLKSLGKRGNNRGDFNFPTLLWLDRNNHLWVTDSLNFRIQKFDEAGKILGTFGKLGDSTGHLSRPKGVATDASGHVYVVDALFHGVQVFDQKGTLLLYFGQQGTDNGEFWLPSGIFVGKDQRIYVADSHNKRIQVFRYVGGAQ